MEKPVSAPQTPSPLMVIRDVRVHFSIRQGLFHSQVLPAVGGVTLALARGETLGLVGESGSGKTTLGRASLRLVRPVAGRVLFDGADITAAPEARLKWFRRRAQAIFQDPFSSIDPFMSIFESVEEPLLIHGVGNREERAERVYRALADVRLTPPEEIGRSYPHLLSGGQRQRVSIARTLVLRPDYIVADEAVSMVDASSRVEILALLKSLQEAYGIAFLYITHDIATARYFAHRIAVMYLGHIVEMGSPAQVIENPLHPYTQALVAAVPEPDPANRLRERPTVPGEPPNPLAMPSGCPFHPRCPSFIRGTCEVARPVLQEMDPGHWVACYLYP